MASPDANLSGASVASAVAPIVSTGGMRRRMRSLKGLLWCEWFAHGRLLLVFLALWLAVVWFLPVLGNPTWILFFGFAYALIAGPAYGGGDVIHGCEEYSFAMPATRTERYAARLAVGGGSLLLFTAMDLLALGSDLPQALAKVYVETAIIKPLPVLKTHLLYGLVFAIPFAVFSFSFSISAVTHSRAMVFTAWFWSALITLLVLNLGFRYEDMVSEQLTGYFSFPLLVALGGAALFLGGFLYSRKEVGHQSAPFSLPAGWWLWALVMLAGMVLAALLVWWLARQYPRIMTGP